MAKSFAFQWHLTEACDQRCRHCYIFSAEKTRIPLKEVSEEGASRIVENCLEMCRAVGRAPYFYLTGGDPLLHSKFWEIAGLLKTRGIGFSILGNPFHLSAQVCERLKSLGCERYQLSIDGLRETHDGIRMAGSFDATLEKVQVLRSAGIRCAVMTTVSKLNLGEIPEIIDLVVSHRVDIFAFARYCPNGFEARAHVTPEEYRELLERCWSRFERYKDAGTYFNLKDHLWTLFRYEKGLFEIPEWLDEGQVYGGCHCGDCHLTILPDGTVYACRRFESAVGNALRERLADVFTGEGMDEYRDFERFEKCGRCELLRFCRGCPAVAYGYSGNMYAADPQCWRRIE